MNPQHRKYKIQKGDTLAGVASKLGCSEYDLKSYHNTYCSLSDLIELEFPKNMTELLLPAIDFVKKITIEEGEKKILLGTNGELILYPTRINKNYGVLITLETGSTVQTIKYEINLRYIKHEEKDMVFEINRISSVYINDYEPDNIADILAVKTAQVLYPLQITVDKTGNFTGIYNHESIVEKWNGVKEEIFEEYEGEFVEKYISLNEEALKSRDVVEQSFLGDFFIRAYFNGIYEEYPNDKSSTKNLLFPVMNETTDISFSVKSTLEEHYDESNFIVLNQSGELAEERAKEDLDEKLGFPYYAYTASAYSLAEGAYRSRYFLNPIDRSIEALYIEASVGTTIPERVKVSVSNLKQDTDFTMVAIIAEEKVEKKSHFLID